LRAQLSALKRAEAEGRADGKQMQVRKQIEERLGTMEKEAAEQPEAYVLPFAVHAHFKTNKTKKKPHFTDFFLA
jgi:hypothetical protein